MKNSHLSCLTSLVILSASQTVFAGPSCDQQAENYTANMSYSYTAPLPISNNTSPIYERIYYDDGTSEVVVMNPDTVINSSIEKTQPPLSAPNSSNNDSTLTFLPPINNNAKQTTSVTQREEVKPTTQNNTLSDIFNNIRKNNKPRTKSLAAPHSPRVDSLNGISIDTGN